MIEKTHGDGKDRTRNCSRFETKKLHSSGSKLLLLYHVLHALKTLKELGSTRSDNNYAVTRNILLGLLQPFLIAKSVLPHSLREKAMFSKILAVEVFSQPR